MTRRRLVRGRLRDPGRPAPDELGATEDLEAEAPDLELDDEPVDDLFDSEIARLYADDSEALARWKARLSQYVDSQGTLDALDCGRRRNSRGPRSNNPMLGYLVERCIEIEDESGLGTAVAWLAANSWFEGAIAERSRFIRLLDAD